MEFSQSRNSTRGPLIAVIKIEIDHQRTDRIFLHQRDNDLRLAELFVQKHNLNQGLVQHIYERIQFSRRSVETQQEKQTAQKQLREPNQSVYSRSNYRLQTPINHIAPEPQAYPQEQSFGTPNIISDRQHKKPKPSSRPFEIQDQELFSAPIRNPLKEATQNNLAAPSKKDIIKAKEFMIYQESERSNLFGMSHIQKKQINEGPFPSNSKKQIEDYMEQPLRFSEKKKKDALQIIQQKEEEGSRLSNSKSMMKLSRGYHQDSKQIQQIGRKCSNSLPKKQRIEYNSKPCQVKVLKKDQIQSVNQSLKKSMSKQEISRINRDVTKRLYNEQDIKKSYLNLIKMKAKKDKEKEVDTELTLKPKINKISQVIAQDRKKNGVPIEDYLIERGRKTEIKRNEVNNKKMMKELQNCSFKPQINMISQRLTANKENFESRLKEQALKKSTYKDPNTFRPSLNKITQQLMKDRGTFQERQRQYLEARNQKLMEMVHDRILGEKIDLQTGQELFKPIINDLGVRESQGNKIGDYLYQLSKEQSEKLQKQSPRPRISQSSQILVEHMHMKRIAWLFGELDSDQDGVISAQKICIDTISPELLEIIKPILFEMQEINEDLTLLQFKNAIGNLHKKLNVNEKGILYNYCSQKCK